MTDHRLDPRGIKPSTTDGDNLQTVGGVAVWGAPAVGVEEVVAGANVSVDNTDPTHPIVSATGGGSGTAGRDRRWNVGPSETSIDEFDDDTLDAAWTRIDSTGESGFAAWTEAADVLSVASGLGTDAAAELHGMVRPLSGAGGSMSVGDGFVACVTNFRTSAFTIGGLVLADGATAGAGNQLLCSLDSGSVPLAPVVHVMTNWSARTSFTSMGTIYGATCFLRMARVASTSWRLDYSPDDISWIRGTAVTSSITPTHAGFAVSSWGNSIPGVMSFEFLRRVSSIT